MRPRLPELVVFVVCAWPALATGTPPASPESLTTTIESDTTPSCVEIRSAGEVYGAYSSEPPQNLKAFDIANNCDAAFEIEPDSCTAVICHAREGCAELECDGDPIRVAPGEGPGAGDTGIDGGDRDASGGDAGDTSAAPDAGRPDGGDTGRDVGGTDAADASDDLGLGPRDTSDAGGSDAFGAPGATVRTYYFRDTGMTSGDFNGAGATVDVIFDWRLGNRDAGQMPVQFTYTSPREPGSGTPTGCGCSAPGDEGPNGMPAAVLATLFGLLVLRRRTA